MARQHVIHHDIITPVETATTTPQVLEITFNDLRDALAKGIDDFREMPTHALFLVALYPIAGIMIARFIFGYDMFPLLYPLAAGFALLGPFAAIGLYELSRRREQGLDTTWTHAFDVRHSASFKSILMLGGLLLMMFAVWIAIAHGLYLSSFGPAGHASLSALLHDVLTTSEGQQFLIVGNLIGLGFAIVAMAISAVSFPLLLDRNIGFAAAIATSFRVVLRNPVVMMTWGVIVAVLLALGSLPFFFGLAVVVPVLGHATWHLYRKTLVPDDGPRPAHRSKPRRPRYAAEFPASLFVGSSVDVDDDRSSG
ncbi:MAG: DUF2189 domain-containing protein [Hyphomicrobiaceae bacterium]|nr:DUF2189 domain-containing protein [Hyphomicrobiaceae bacterium]